VILSNLCVWKTTWEIVAEEKNWINEAERGEVEDKPGDITVITVLGAWIAEVGWWKCLEMDSWDFDGQVKVILISFFGVAMYVAVSSN
jgi:hypothetical protein